MDCENILKHFITLYYLQQTSAMILFLLTIRFGLKAALILSILLIYNTD